MRGYLLDTNVISELRKSTCNEAVKAWSEFQPAEVLFLSTVTLAEIRYGIENQPAPAFRSILGFGRGLPVVSCQSMRR